MHRLALLLLASLFSLESHATDLPASITESLRAPFDTGTAEEQNAAVDAVLASSENTNALKLFVASNAALGLGRVEDSAFLYYAAQLRRNYDFVVFPPASGSESDARGTVELFNQVIGMMVNPEIMRKPEAFERVVRRLEAWEMRVDSNYDPGWKYTRREPNPQLADKLKEDYLQGAHEAMRLIKRK